MESEGRLSWWLSLAADGPSNSASLFFNQCVLAMAEIRAILCCSSVPIHYPDEQNSSDLPNSQMPLSLSLPVIDKAAVMKAVLHVRVVSPVAVFALPPLLYNVLKRVKTVLWDRRYKAFNKFIDKLASNGLRAKHPKSRIIVYLSEVRICLIQDKMEPGRLVLGYVTWQHPPPGQLYRAKRVRSAPVHPVLAPLRRLAYKLPGQ